MWNAEELNDALRIVRTEVEMSWEMLRWEKMPDYGLDLVFGAQPQHDELRAKVDLSRQMLRWEQMPDYGLDLVFGGQSET